MSGQALGALMKVNGRTCPCSEMWPPHSPADEIGHRAHLARHTLPATRKVEIELTDLLESNPDPDLLVALVSRVHRLEIDAQLLVALYRRTGYIADGSRAHRPTTVPRLYRAATKQGKRGAFWTSHEGTADDYARRGGAAFDVYSTQPDPAAVLARYMHARGHGPEFVLDPSMLGHVEKVTGPGYGPLDLIGGGQQRSSGTLSLLGAGRPRGSSDPVRVKLW